MKNIFRITPNRPILLVLSMVIILIIASIGLAITDSKNDSSSQSYFYSAGLVASLPDHKTGDYLTVQKIGIDVPIILNVDGSNKNKYFEALRKGVAHMKGTAEAGENGNVFIFGHSSGLENYGDFKAIFARLNDLEKDDDIIVFSGGEKFNYVVSEKKVVEPTYTDATHQDKKEKKLTLMTCWPLGSNAKRLIVTAYLQK